MSATATDTHKSAQHVRVIEPQRGWSLPDLREIKDYGDLVYMLVKRDVAVRYRQTAVGVVWAVIQPMALAAVFAIFLGKLAKVPSGGDIPYALYVFSGMVMWLYLQSAFLDASQSMVISREMISKVYFPRMVVPLAAVIRPLVDLCVALVVVLVVMAAYGYTPGLEMLLIPLPIVLAFATALGFSLWMSALNVRYRDVQHIVPFLALVGMFVTPIAYPFSLVPENLQPLYALNPIVGVLEIWRFTLFGEMTGDWWLPIIPVAAAIALLVTGAMYFVRAERSFADLI